MEQEKVEEWVALLWASLNRAGPQWREDIGLDRVDEGFLVTLFCDQLAQKSRRAVRKYIQLFAQAHGYTVPTCVMSANKIHFLLSMR